MACRARDLEAGFEEEEVLERGAERAVDKGAQGGAGWKGVVELEEEEELEEEKEQKGQEYEAGSRGRVFSLDELFEEELVAYLEEYEQLIQEVQFELEVTKTERRLATGRMLEYTEAGPVARAQQLGTPGTAAFAGQAGWARVGPVPLSWEP